MAPLIQALLGGASMGAATLLLAFAYLNELPSPYIPLGGDSVAPAQAKMFETVAVTRNYEITRAAPMFIVRTMTRGDCRASCEIVDLSSGHLLLPVGVYRNVVRDHIIPSSAQPGQWVLRFSVQWQDRFGRTLTAALPPLQIEVIP